MPVLVVKAQPLTVLHRRVDLELEHDPVEADLRDALGKVRIELALVEVLTWNEADLGEPRERWRIGGGRGIGLHQFGEKREIFDRVQLVDLIAHRRLHVDGGIDLPGRRRVRLAVATERDQLDLILERVNGFVIFRRAGAVDAAKQPNQARRRFILLHAVGKRALTSPGPVMA